MVIWGVREALSLSQRAMVDSPEVTSCPPRFNSLNLQNNSRGQALYDPYFPKGETEEQSG